MHLKTKSLEFEVMPKLFLQVLDDIWEEEDEGRYKSKWKNVFVPLACGSLEKKILLTTQMDSIAMKIAKAINKKETLRLEGLEERDCSQLLNQHRVPSPLASSTPATARR